MNLDSYYEMKVYSEEIKILQQRLSRFMNCEVSEKKLVPLKDEIKEKQKKLLEMIEKEYEGKNEKI